MAKLTAHTKLLNDIVAALYERYGRTCCIQKINVVNAVVTGRGGASRRLVSAQPGTADLIGVIGGLPVAIEVKVGKDRQRPAQESWQRAWESAGGCYILARSVEQVLEEVRT